MHAEELEQVFVTWGRADDTTLLRRAVAAGLDVAIDEIVEVRVCPSCGASDHGRPFVRHRGASAGWVSLSRHDDVAVVVWSPTSPVGVDVDAVGREAWVRREARGKTDGTGITGTDPSHVRTRPLEAPVGLTAAIAVDTSLPWVPLVT